MVSYKALNTTPESSILNRCGTIWNIYAGEKVAPRKSPISNRCDTIWDIYAGERVAAIKSTLSNRCDTIRNCIVFFSCYVRNKSSFIFIE